jgi:predicted dehydrogenase
LTRIAILGARHPHVFPRVDLLRATPGVSLIGFHERDAEIAGRFAELTGLERFDSASALLARRPDGVIVDGLDPEVPRDARVAADAGARALLLEKPGAATPDEFLKLATELNAKGVEVEIGYELHYCDAVARCREIVGGALGQITLARLHGGCPIGAGAELWQSIPEDLGGLVFTEGSHMLEIGVELLGVPEKIDAVVRRLPPGDPVQALVYKPDLFSPPDDEASFRVGTLAHEDVAAAILHYPDRLVTVDFTAWEPTYWCKQWAIEAYGTNGALQATIEPMEVHVTLRQATAGYPAGETILRAPAPRPGSRLLLDSYRRQLDRFVALASGDTSQPGCDLARGVDVMRIMQAIYEASAAGQTTPVPRSPVGIGAIGARA